MLKPGDPLALTFTTRNPTTGQAQDASSTPTAVLRRNGVTDGAVSVSVAKNATGDYKASCTIPSGYADGDVVQIVVSATVAGVSDSKELPPFAIGKKEGYSISSVSGVMIDDGLNMQEVLAYMQAILFGTLDGADGGSLQFATPSGGADRVLVVADADNNRTAITLTPLE